MPEESRIKTIAKISLFVALLPIILPLAAIMLTFILLYKWSLYLLIWLLWLPRGKMCSS